MRAVLLAMVGLFAVGCGCGSDPFEEDPHPKGPPPAIGDAGGPAPKVEPMEGVRDKLPKDDAAKAPSGP